MPSKNRIKVLLPVAIAALLLGIAFTRASFASTAQDLLTQIRKTASGVFIVNENPIKVTSTPTASTQSINYGIISLNPGQTMTVTEATGSGKFQDIWYSASSPLVSLKITVDDGDVWNDPTQTFCLNSMLNKQSVGFAGATACGETNTQYGPVWGGYITPPQGFPFQKYLRIQFTNNDTTPKIVYSSRGQYVLN